MKNLSLVLVSLPIFFIVLVLGDPKKYIPGEDSNGSSFQPSNVHNRYYESNIPEHSRNSTPKDKDAKESTAVNRFQRFGQLPGLSAPGYGNTGAGVPGYPPPGAGGITYMKPMQIDIGGVALGAILGLGAVLIAPKLISLFHMVGPAYRSLDSDNSTITNFLARIDSSLEEHNIDSSSCMQRIICSYVNEAQKNLENGETNSVVDEVVLALSNNPLFTYMLDGSAVKQAIDMGKKGDFEKCASLYSKCPISRENVLQVISSLLPK